jgi:voltage-gated potassium channel
MEATTMTPEGKLRLAISLLVLTLSIGVGGYMIIEKWSFLDSMYMTFITLTTVGFGETHQLSDAGRTFTILLIAFGVFNAGFLITAAVQLTLEGHLQAILGRHKMERKVHKLKNHIILCGYGRVGRKVASEFLRRGESFVIIENDQTMIPENGHNGLLFVVGSAAEDDVLMKSGIDRARAIVSTLPDDAENVYLTLTARHLNAGLFIIARADTDLAKKKLARAGANKVICPHELGGMQMAMATLRPNVVDFMRLAAFAPGGENLGVEEISIRDGGALTGKSIIEAAIKSKYDAIVVGLRKKDGQMVFNPSGETRMESGDILIALGESNKLEQLGADLG